MVANHTFHKLVHSARLFMKKASRGCCVLAFDSSGEPAGQPGFSGSCARVFSGTEFEVGRTSGEDGLVAIVMLPWIVSQVCIVLRVCCRGRFGLSYLCSVFRSSRRPSSWVWGGGQLDRSWNAETEDVKKCQNFSSPGTFGAECVNFSRLFGSRPQSGIAGAGFRRWLVSGRIEELLSGVPRWFLIFIVLF